GAGAAAAGACAAGAWTWAGAGAGAGSSTGAGASAGGVSGTAAGDDVAGAAAEADVEGAGDGVRGEAVADGVAEAGDWELAVIQFHQPKGQASAPAGAEAPISSPPARTRVIRGAAMYLLSFNTRRTVPTAHATPDIR
ncbi:MAG: hypothetical protein JWQ56_1172, partial [Pseudarthrobacter sp.]|nr:hypothetical protein [Pseudarthrobacter sp.]